TPAPQGRRLCFFAPERTPQSLQALPGAAPIGAQARHAPSTWHHCRGGIPGVCSMRCGSSPLLAALSLTTTFAASAGAQTIINPVGPQPNGYFGHAVAASPDLNGDGLADVIIGAPGEAHAGLAAAGRVHVVSGANGVRLRTLVSPHAKAGGLFGYAVASVPDANGDGVPDILVGAPDEDADFIGA